MRGFHGITPETDETCHYFWSMASTKHPQGPENIDEVINQIRLTFDEDRVVIEKQFRNMREFAQRAEWMDIHVDVGANRARRIVQRLAQPQAAVP
jgi:hypothetical protein